MTILPIMLLHLIAFGCIEAGWVLWCVGIGEPHVIEAVMGASLLGCGLAHRYGAFVLSKRLQSLGAIATESSPYSRGGVLVEPAAYLFLPFTVVCLMPVRWNETHYFPAIGYTFLTWFVGVIIILARRVKLTWGDVAYLQWAWLPMFMVGVPAFIHVWRAKGVA